MRLYAVPEAHLGADIATKCLKALEPRNDIEVIVESIHKSNVKRELRETIIALSVRQCWNRSLFRFHGSVASRSCTLLYPCRSHIEVSHLIVVKIGLGGCVARVLCTYS